MNYGAGRGSWYFEDTSFLRRKLQDVKSYSNEYIGLDIDPVVMLNPTTSSNYLIIDNSIPFTTASIDIVIADWVLEHLENPSNVFQEIDRVLVPGGIFCARTPHKYNLISVIAKIVPNTYHTKILKYVQPGRKDLDVFPTVYRANTKKDIMVNFPGYKDFCYLFVPEITYDFDNSLINKVMNLAKHLLPKVCFSYMHIFLQKDGDEKSI